MLVERLRQIQNEHGYLPDAELRKLARDADVPLHRVEEVSSFFPLFRLERHDRPDVVLRVCRDMSCHLRGAAALLDPQTGLAADARKVAAATGKKVAVEGVSCLGRCDRAPAAWAERHPAGEDHGWVYCGRSRADLVEVVRRLAAGEAPPAPDRDDEYLPNTNPGPAAWQIDVYGRDRDRDYAAVQWAVDDDGGGLARTPKPPPADLPAAELEGYVERVHPALYRLKPAGLSGMGGAGALAYQKWLDVWRAGGSEKYVVANGDESEPGTFKDRELMLRTPHLVVEGVILAGLATGATRGYIYVRHEYHEQIHALREEIARAEALGACGADVFDSGRAFPVEVFESPGGYICGEQSALLEAMEGKRAQPRTRPPELSTNGLWDKPTVVNNVETLAWAPFIMLRKPEEYAAAGHPIPGAAKGFVGRRLLSVSGDVRRPGVYEVPVGMPLRELVEGEGYCGGVVGGRLKAVATSGPSGGFLPATVRVPREFFEGDRRAKAAAGPIGWFFERFLPPGADRFDVLDLPLDLGFFRTLHGAVELRVEPMLGAGLVVYNDKADMLSQAANASEFFRNESCGKCVPCRLGSQKLVQIGTDLVARRAAGQPLAGDDARELGRDVREVMRTLQQTSICGLGYVAPSPLASALAYFATDVSAAPRPQ
ncbi:MAG: NADH-quinone oxidoreductase subunit L [Isosphaera sp.]|nr:NADH-quinone oxidoreductase subunit L [Isosphaera sp.]